MKDQSKSLKIKLKEIKLLILDVDGVLTGEEIIYSDSGSELKVFNVKDGLGVYLLSLIGIKVIFLSAKNSPILKKRAQDMNVAEVRGGKLPKENELKPIMAKYRVKKSQICFVGDDLIDIGIAKKCGTAVAVKNACPELKKVCHYTTSRCGGKGAVREVADLIIKAKDKEKKILSLLKNRKTSSS